MRRLSFSGHLSCACRLNAIKDLRVEPTIISRAVLPFSGLELQVVFEVVVALNHLSMLPMRLILSAVWVLFISQSVI